MLRVARCKSAISGESRTFIKNLLDGQHNPLYNTHPNKLNTNLQLSIINNQLQMANNKQLRTTLNVPRNTTYYIRHTRQFMQNKPNLPYAQMNVNFFVPKDYQNQPLRRLPENKPNQTQSRNNSNRLAASQLSGKFAEESQRRGSCDFYFCELASQGHRAVKNDYPICRCSANQLWPVPAFSGIQMRLFTQSLD